MECNPQSLSAGGLYEDWSHTDLSITLRPILRPLEKRNDPLLRWVLSNWLPGSEGEGGATLLA